MDPIEFENISDKDKSFKIETNLNMDEDANLNKYDKNEFKKPESFENDPFVFEANNTKNFNDTNDDKEYLNNFDDNLSNNGKNNNYFDFRQTRIR
jgi:hypothetical protein